MSPWWTKLELLFWYFIFKSSHCESFEDRVPVDEISSDLTMMRGHQNSSTDNDHQSTYRIFTTKFLLCDCTLSTRYHSICCYSFCVTFSEKCPEPTETCVCIFRASAPFHEHGLTWSIAWRRNYIHYKACHGITKPLSNFNGATVEVWKWISNLTPHFIRHVITHLCWDLS